MASVLGGSETTHLEDKVRYGCLLSTMGPVTCCFLLIICLINMLHRLSEGNLPSIAKTIESLYGVNARAELSAALTRVILDVTLMTTHAPSRVVTDIAMLLAVLHSRIGCEVTAAFLHELISQYQQLFDDAPVAEAGKQLDNALLLLSQLYNFKVCC